METILENIVALIALSAMEIVLGIDNLVFISILTSKLPIESQSSGRRWGLALALVMRILLLSMIFWMSRMTAPMVRLSDHLPVNGLQRYFMTPDESDQEAHETNAENQADGSNTGQEIHAETPHHVPKKTAKKILNAHAWREFNEVSWRDIILMAGGLFLLYKSIREIHGEMEGHDAERQANLQQPSFGSVLFQIALMDIIFSLDSVITAVGMADALWVMITAVILAVTVMILFANQVGNFVSNNPTIKMLALNFLLIIGIMLVAEGIGTPISKGYIYFAMAFSLMVEFLNLRVRKVATVNAPMTGS
jgi:predicted tellurium resistance membrane protein TerC